MGKSGGRVFGILSGIEIGDVAAEAIGRSACESSGHVAGGTSQAECAPTSANLVTAA